MRINKIEDVHKFKIIFNHTPKAGGQSIIYFFEQVFGRNRCFRHRARNMKTNQHTKGIEELSEDELENYYFFAGHFDYGHHHIIPGPTLYIGVVRDPLERLISDYFFNQKFGKPRLKALANQLSFEDYAWNKINSEGTCSPHPPCSSGDVSCVARSISAG